MFPLGSVVRLRRGWTPLVVIKHGTNGVIYAKYANHDCYPVTVEDYDTSSYSSMSTQRRHFNEFVPWDGDPISKVHFLMPNRYKSISRPHICGTYMNTSSNGHIIIECDNGKIEVLAPNDAARDIPFTFQAKSMNSPYKCHYTVAPGVRVAEGDLLLSATGNLYTVIAVNTEQCNPKGQFKGKRVVLMDL